MLVTLFYGKEKISSNIFYNLDADMKKRQNEYRAFLRRFLPSLYARLKINGVVGAAIYYIQDYDWGVVSDEIGVPYIVLHRENLVTSPKMREKNYNLSKRIRQIQRFSYYCPQQGDKRNLASVGIC